MPRPRSTAAVAFLAALVPALSLAAPPPKEQAPAKGGAAVKTMFRPRYEPPKNPAHQAIYDEARGGRVLEQFSDALAAIRLPRPLIVQLAGCDGRVNAWYEETDGTVTFCYEFVAEFEKNVPGALEHGLTRNQAVWGPVLFVLLHETSHAMFDMLKVPILGREEDAADHLAAFILLRAGDEVARRILTGAAWMYFSDAKGRKIDESDLSDVHALDAQRYYNVLCMAYGHDQKVFGFLVEKERLPKDRAEDCLWEYKQIAFAVKKLIAPSVEGAEWERSKAARKARWEGSQPAQPAAGGEKPK